MDMKNSMILEGNLQRIQHTFVVKFDMFPEQGNISQSKAHKTFLLSLSIFYFEILILILRAFKSENISWKFLALRKILLSDLRTR
jgi:hypothetical protein